MIRIRLSILFLLVVFVFSQSATARQGYAQKRSEPCPSLSEMEGHLAVLGYKPILKGRVAEGDAPSPWTRMRLYITKKKTWAVTYTRNGQSCLVGAGDDMRVYFEPGS